MAQYESFDPNVEVIGQAIQSTLVGLDEQTVPILKKHNLYPIDPESWYNQQAWMDAFKEIAGLGFMNMVAIGMRVPDNAKFPPDIEGVHSVLGLLNVAYQMNHRGGEIGSYDYEPTGERSGVMVCRNPYPSDFDYGLIYRTVQKFVTDESEDGIIVKRDDTVKNRTTGGDTCRYEISW